MMCHAHEDVGVAHTPCPGAGREFVAPFPPRGSRAYILTDFGLARVYQESSLSGLTLQPFAATL